MDGPKLVQPSNVTPEKVKEALETMGQEAIERKNSVIIGINQLLQEKNCRMEIYSIQRQNAVAEFKVDIIPLPLQQAPQQ